MTPRTSFLGILLVFLRLGLTSFGGPIAHIGYLRTEFVERRRWLGEAAFADLVALAQFLPGPASSQLGFSIGLLRGGARGGLAAWIGFTLPSAVLMALAAWGLPFASGPLAAGMIHGLKLVAVAVVAQAVWGMATGLCPDRPRAGIALLAAAVTLLLPGALGQLGILLAGAAAGLALGKAEGASAEALPHFGISAGAGLACLGLFVLLLAGLPLLAGAGGLWALAESAYRAGALVFGGGHVVLPLLERGFVGSGWMSAEDFLAGYALAQAVPGPLFTFAVFLGAAVQGLAGALVALVAIFLPGLLLMAGALPFWDRLRRQARAQAALRGVNAAVVGLLLAALLDPVWSSAVRSPADAALALLAFAALMVARLPAWQVVLLGALVGAVSLLA